MGLFTPSKPTSPRPITSRPARPRSSMTTRELNKAIGRLPGLKRAQRQFLQAKFEYGRPGKPMKLNKRDFDKVLREMARDPRDPITRTHVARLKKIKKELFR